MMAPPGEELLVVWIVAYAMCITLGGWLTLIGYEVRSRVLRPEQTLWGYFALAGFTATILGVLGIAWLASDYEPTLFGAVVAVQLGFVVLCSLVLREAYYNRVFANSERDRIGQFPMRRLLELGFVGAIVLVGLGPLVGYAFSIDALAGQSVRTFAGLIGVVVVCYGSYFHHRRTHADGTRGTVIDTMLRHLFPVLAFAGGGLVTALLPIVGIGHVVVDALAGILLVMTATALVPLLVKFRQHLSAHR